MSAAVNDPSSLPSWAKSTSGRSGATYRDFLAKNPNFDPYTNLETYTGAGGSQSAAAQQAFGWLNEWARNNGYADGKNIPLQQRQQMYLAFLERAHQGIQDRGEDWGADAASKIPEAYWSYNPGWGLTHGGQSWEQQQQQPPAPPPNDRNAPTPADLAARGGQQPGGTTVSVPLGGDPNDPNTPVTNINPLTGLPAGTPAGPAAIPQQPGLPAAGGGAAGIDPANLNLYYDDPQRLWAAYSARMNLPVNQHSRLFERLKQRLMPQLLAYVDATRRLGGNLDDTSGQVGGFANAVRGGNLYGTLRGLGQRQLDLIQSGGLADTADQADVEQAIQRSLGLGLAGQGSLEQSAALNAYQDMLEEYGNTALQPGSGGVETGTLPGYLQRSTFWKLAKQLGLA